MSSILYIAGLLIGIAAFLYILTLMESGKKAVKNITSNSPEKRPDNINSPENSSDTKIDSDEVSFRKRPPLLPGTRVCPLCGSTLTKREGLYASKVYDKDNAKILIMGCRYCYKDDENGAVQKIAVAE